MPINFSTLVGARAAAQVIPAYISELKTSWSYRKLGEMGEGEVFENIYQFYF